MTSIQQQLGVLGTIPTFAYRHMETKKNLCPGGLCVLTLAPDGFVTLLCSWGWARFKFRLV